MSRGAQHEIKILLNYLGGMTPLSEREIEIGKACYFVGRCVREDEILYNRSLFDDDEDNGDRKNKIRN